MWHILILLGIQYLKYKINKKLVRLSGTKRHTAGWSEKTTSPPSARVATMRSVQQQNNPKAKLH